MQIITSMMIYDHTAELFPNGSEILLRDLGLRLTQRQVVDVLLSENTYLRKRIDGSASVGHLHYRERDDATLGILTKHRPAFGFSGDDMYDLPRPMNVIVEYRTRSGGVLVRKGEASEVPELRGCLEKYMTAEGQ
jgi:hypothetical protein